MREGDDSAQADNNIRKLNRNRCDILDVKSPYPNRNSKNASFMISERNTLDDNLIACLEVHGNDRNISRHR